MEEVLADPLDFRRDSKDSRLEALSKESSGRLEIPLSPTKKRMLSSESLTARDNALVADDTPSPNSPAISRVPSQSLLKTIPRGGYLVQLIKFLVMTGGNSFSHSPFFDRTKSFR